MKSSKLLSVILNVSKKKLIIGGVTATLTLGVVGGVVYYNKNNQEKEVSYSANASSNEAKSTEESKIEEQPKEATQTPPEVKEEVVAEGASQEPKEGEKKTEQSTEVNKQESSGSTNVSTSSPKPSTPPVEQPKTPAPPVEEPKPSTPPVEEPKPSIPVGFNQEATNKINAVNSYGGDKPGQNRQAYINACIAIANGQSFDKASLSTYYEGKEKLKYISHTDNVVIRDEAMSYFNDYKNPEGFNSGFKYTVAFWTGSKWKLHCVTIRVA